MVASEGASEDDTLLQFCGKHFENEVASLNNAPRDAAPAGGDRERERSLVKINQLKLIKTTRSERRRRTSSARDGAADG